MIIKNGNVLTRAFIILAKSEALDTEKRQLKLRFSGYDISPEAIKLALYHAKKAKVLDNVHLQVRDVSCLSSKYAKGTIVTNPPYGERLLDIDKANELYTILGNKYRELNIGQYLCLQARRNLKNSLASVVIKTANYITLIKNVIIIVILSNNLF